MLEYLKIFQERALKQKQIIITCYASNIQPVINVFTLNTYRFLNVKIKNVMCKNVHISRILVCLAFALFMLFIGFFPKILRFIVSKKDTHLCL